jgi:hypothetical protein
MTGEIRFQMACDGGSNRATYHNRINILEMAGAGGIEPPNGGIKIRCLTAWLRPNAPIEGHAGL